MGEMGIMRTRQQTQKQSTATRVRKVSLDTLDPQDHLDRKMLEAIARIERVRSMALAAVGTMLSAQR